MSFFTSFLTGAAGGFFRANEGFVDPLTLRFLTPAQHQAELRRQEAERERDRREAVEGR